MFAKQVALVVDDSTQVQNIVKGILKQHLGFGGVLTASNGRQALQFFDSQQVDWIFCDWEMPVMNGEEFLVAVRKHPKGQDVPFVLMTSHANQETVTAAISAGISDFIAKPFSPMTFVQKIRRLATAAERRISPRVTPLAQYACQIQFPVAKCTASLINISISGCLLRALAFRDCGSIYEPVRLVFSLENQTAELMAELVRIEIDRTTSKDEIQVLAAFQFLPMDSETKATIVSFITQQQTQMAMNSAAKSPGG
jgi:two-component system chemotaxis response regulator CheY